MKTFAKLAAAVPLIAACGGAIHPDDAAQESAPAQQIECAVTLAPKADLVHVRNTLNMALEGAFDPCSGGVAQAPAVDLQQSIKFNLQQAPSYNLQQAANFDLQAAAPKPQASAPKVAFERMDTNVNADGETVYTLVFQVVRPNFL